MSDNIGQLNARIAAPGLSQERVAIMAKVDHTALSRMLRGVRRMDTDTFYRVRDAVEALEAANRAAEAARRRVLRERGYGDAA